MNLKHLKGYKDRILYMGNGKRILVLFCGISKIFVV